MNLTFKGLFLTWVLLSLLYNHAAADADTKAKESDNIVRIEMLLDMARSNMNKDSTSSIGYLKSAARLSKEINYTYGEALSYYLLGKIYGFGIMDLYKGIQYHKKSIALIEQSDSLDLLGKNFSARGMQYYLAGLYATAMNDFLVSANYYKKNGDSLNLAISRVNIASIYSEWCFDSYPKAIKDFDRAIQAARALKSDYLFVYTVLFYSHSLIANGEYEKAKTYLEQAIPVAEKSKGLNALRCKLYINMGDVLIHEKSISQAEKCFRQAEELSKTSGMMYFQGDVAFALGRLCEAKNRYQEAEGYYQSALQLFTQMKVKKSIIAVYQKLASRAEARNDLKQAVYLKSLLLCYEDSISKIQHHEILDQMHTSIHSISQSQQMEIQKKNEQIKQLYINTFIIAIASLSLTALLYFNKKRLRESKDRAVLAKEKLILQKELENIKIGEEQLKQTLEFNAKTLTANTLNLIQKNEILEKIKTKAEEVRKALPDDLPAKINSLINTANFALNIDKDWENFRIHFEQVHNNFFESLKTRYPDLNSNDLRLCALLKLNLDTKEIATIMDISPESVKVARSRLRKKLQLETSDNLSSFITQV